MYITYERGRDWLGGPEGHIFRLLCTLGECPMFQKNIGDGPIKWLLLKRKKKKRTFGSIDELIIEG
jgi:hypothetical protein